MAHVMSFQTKCDGINVSLRCLHAKVEENGGHIYSHRIRQYCQFHRIRKYYHN